MRKSHKVVLIEDDVSLRNLLRTLLEIERFQVCVASDHTTLEHLVSFVVKEDPDAILMDVQINNLSGLEVLRQVRKFLAPGRVKIIMVSGYDLKDACIEAGADKFIMKPFMPDEIISSLR